MFLCCLPSHIPTIAGDIAGHVSNECVIFSYATGITLPRYDFVLTTELLLRELVYTSALQEK